MFLLIRRVPWCCLGSDGHPAPFMNTWFHCFTSGWFIFRHIQHISMFLIDKMNSLMIRASHGSEHRSHLAAGSGSLNCSNDQQRPNLPERENKTIHESVGVLCVRRTGIPTKLSKFLVIPVSCDLYVVSCGSAILRQQQPRSISMMLGTWPQCHQQWMTWQNTSRGFERRNISRRLCNDWNYHYGFQQVRNLTESAFAQENLFERRESCLRVLEKKRDPKHKSNDLTSTCFTELSVQPHSEVLK